MPGKERLQKRKDQYEKLYQVFGNIITDDPYAKQKNALKDALGLLNEKIAALTAGEDAREKKLSEEQTDEMITAYSKIIKAVDNLLNKMNNRLEALTKAARIRRLNRSEKIELDDLKSEVLQFELLVDTLSKDAGAFRKAKKDNKSLSMYEIYESSRVNSSYKLKEDQEIAFESGNYNTRIKLTLTDEDNNEIEGYFTEETDDRITQEEEQRRAFEKNRKKYGSSGDFISYNQLKKIVDETMPEEINRLVGLNLAEEDYKDARRIISDFIIVYNMKRMLNTPAKLRAFWDMLTDYVDIKAHYVLQENMGLNDHGHDNRRNTAVSGMAALLGCDNLVAHSQNIKITINGEEKKGTFMKKAVGEDINKAKFDSDLVYTLPNATENLNLKKQVADLQILDFVCGNPDRHVGNMLYITERDENDNVIVTGIQGIDNDASFGGEDLFDANMSEIHLEDMKVITREMADKILALDAEILVQMFYGYELGEKEIGRAYARLRQLQEKIREDDRFYAEGYAKGVLVEGRIKIVDDNELNDLSFRYDLAKGGDENLFKRIDEAVAGRSTLRNIYDNYEEDYRKSVKKFTTDTLLDFADTMESIVSDDKTFQTGSPQYTEMRKCTKNLLKAMRSYIGSDYETDKTGTKIMSEGLLDIKQKIEDALEACRKYQEYKHERNQREGKQDFDTSPHKLTRAERRWQNVEKNIALLEKQKTLFDKMQEKMQIFADASIRYKDLEKEMRDAVAKVPAEDRSGIEDKRAYENFKSRSRYLILAEALNAKKSGSELLYKIKLGYAIKALKPEDKAAFRNDIEKATGEKLKADEDELFRDALAYEIIYHQIRLSEKLGSRAAAKNEYLNDLEKLMDLDDGWDDKYENLVKMKAFDLYCKEVSEKFNIDSPEYADERKNTEGKFVNKVTTKMMEHIDPKDDVESNFENDGMLDILQNKIKLMGNAMDVKKMTDIDRYNAGIFNYGYEENERDSVASSSDKPGKTTVKIKVPGV